MFIISGFALTVGLQSSWLTASASCLVNGLDNKDILGATLQTMHRVVVLLDVGHDHPTIQRVAQTWAEMIGRGERERHMRGLRKKTLHK